MSSEKVKGCSKSGFAMRTERATALGWLPRWRFPASAKIVIADQRLRRPFSQIYRANCLSKPARNVSTSPPLASSEGGRLDGFPRRPPEGGAIPGILTRLRRSASGAGKRWINRHSLAQVAAGRPAGASGLTARTNRDRCWRSCAHMGHRRGGSVERLGRHPEDFRHLGARDDWTAGDGLAIVSLAATICDLR